jgi:hypothetical protein
MSASKTSLHPGGSPLDRLAKEAIRLFVMVLVRCGYSPRACADYFANIASTVSPAPPARRSKTVEDVDRVAHVLTLWRNDRRYLLPSGEPRALPAEGPAPSIEALVQQVGGELTLKEALHSLIFTHSLERQGNLYLPSYDVAHPSNSPQQQAHHMRVLGDMLRTLDHNTRTKQSRHKWAQYAVDNVAIPVGHLPALMAALRAVALPFLLNQDALMYRLAAKRKPGERCVSVSFGLYLSIGKMAAGWRSWRSGRRSRRRARPKRKT